MATIPLRRLDPGWTGIDDSEHRIMRALIRKLDEVRKTFIRGEKLKELGANVLRLFAIVGRGHGHILLRYGCD